MLPNYHMFTINILFLMSVALVLAIYRYIYPKKAISPLIALFIISCLPIISVFRQGVYESGDFVLHIYRAMDFYQSLSEGNIFPSWAGNLNAHYGYPLFLFINPLPYYLISFFHCLGFSFITSMKIFLATSYISSGIAMYLFLKQLLSNEKSAFVAAIFYLFAPYHLIDQHFRVTVGEIAIFTTLPLLCYAGMLLCKKRTVVRFLSVSFCTILVISSHQAMATFALPLSLLLFLFFGWKNKLSFIWFALGIVTGILFSSYLLYPYISYTHFVHVSSYTQVIFQPLSDLFYSKWRGGFLYQGPNGELVTPIGYAHLLILPMFVYIYFKKKKFKSLTITLLLLTTLLFFLLTPYSRTIWNTIPLIHLLILPSRLLLFISFLTAIIAGIVAIYTFNRVFILLLIASPILVSLLNWGARNTIYPIGDQVLRQELPFSTKGPEGWGIGIPKWKTPMEFEGNIPNEPLSTLEGTGVIKNLKRTTTYHSYVVSTNTNTILLEKTWYFPGWFAYIDTKPTPILTSLKGYEGIIAVTIPSGLHKLEFKYKDDTVLKTLKDMLLIFIMVYGVLCARLLVKKRQNS